ncbi:MAG: ferrochelatase [Burkholderiales bacterium]|nr:ferrochelatase [Burkholderiales bacterium]
MTEPGSTAPRTAVLLCNLGTPDAPDAPALRRYLGEFLSDPRVVELPAWLWQPILRGVILNVRPAKSAAKYATVWTPDGSPLLVWTRKQAALLQGWLGERGTPVTVRPAMRYGQPSIPAQLDALRAEGVQRVLLLPAYPQYCGATTASTFDAFAAWGSAQRVLPDSRFVAGYHDDPGYIHALAESVRRHWKIEGRSPMVVASFHGMPERTRTLGDPYHDQCQATARLLAEALELPPEQLRVTFQSRFGKAKWLEPATEPTLERLARDGHRRVDVICPGFSADCLETLEEIAQEARDAFLAAGGQQFHYIPCLNDDPLHIAALGRIVTDALAGWPR